jgi:hypothetical protein
MNLTLTSHGFQLLVYSHTQSLRGGKIIVWQIKAPYRNCILGGLKLPNRPVLSSARDAYFPIETTGVSATWNSHEKILFETMHLLAFQIRLKSYNPSYARQIRPDRRKR